MQTNNTNNKRFREEDTLIQQILSKYLPYWSYFLLALVTGAVLAFIYLKYTNPVYEAKAAILIKDEKKGSEESKLAASLNQISSNVIVENEVEILQSFSLMENTATVLHLYAPVSEKGRFKSKSAYVSSPLIIEVPFPETIKTFNNKDSLKKYNKIYFSYDEADQKVLLGDNQKLDINKVINTAYGPLKFMANPYYEKPLEPSGKFFFTLINPKQVVPGLLGNLAVEPSGKLSSFVNLSFKDEVPERARDILNQIITSYRQAEVNEKDTLAKNTLLFVSHRLNLVANELDSIERKIQQYKSGRGAVDIGKQGQLYLESVSSNDQKLGDIMTQLSVLDQVEKFVRSKENSGGIVPSALGISDPVLSQLIDRLYSSELQYEKLKKTVGENYPGIISIKDQSELLKSSILQNIESQKQSLSAARRNINSTSGAYNSLLQVVPQKERQLLDISREQQIKGNIYAFLLQKKEESEMAYASTISNSQVVDMAHISPYPVTPKKFIVLFMTIFGSLGLCLAIIFLREFFLDRVKYRSEIQSLTDIPIIAEIDFDKSKSPVIIRNGEKRFTAEQFRKLRLSLSFFDIDSNHKKILVTSGIAGEGKSFVAANLALSLASTGKSVILVDMDLHKPFLSKTFKFEHQEGVAEFLMGTIPPKDIIHMMEEYGNLSFIAAGNGPGNPSELFTSGNPRKLVDYLGSIFDYVIFDTSPILLVNDGYILAELCDASLYVIRQNFTPRMIIKKFEENDQINPLNNTGIVFNGVKTRGFFKNYSNYGYDYGYIK